MTALSLAAAGGFDAQAHTSGRTSGDVRWPTLAVGVDAA